MVKEFQEALARLGVSYEVRSNNPKDDEITMSDGSKRKLVDRVLVRYWPKKGKAISFSVVTARRIK